MFVAAADRKRQAPVVMSLAMKPQGISPSASLTLARSIPANVDELTNMGPFELYKTQMEDGNTEAKVDAMKRLPVGGVWRP